MKQLNILLGVGLAVLTAARVSGSAIGDDPYYWRDVSGTWTWNDPAHWSATSGGLPNTGHASAGGTVNPGYPEPGNIPHLENGATVTINTDLPTLLGGSGQFNQFFMNNGTTLNITSTGKLKPGWFNVMPGTTLNLAGTVDTNSFRLGTPMTISSSTALINSTGLGIGQGGPATLTQSAGTVNVPGDGQLHVGESSTGAYNLQGGNLTIVLNSNTHLYVGYGAAGTLTQTGGTAQPGVVHIGRGTTTTGVYEISGGSIRASSLWVGDPANTASGTFRVVGSGATSIITGGYWWPGTYGTNGYYQTANGALEYMLDQGGATLIQVKALDSGGTGNVRLAGLLKVDVTGYAEIGAINLMNYAGAVTGAFNTVTIQSFDAVAPPGNLLQPWTPVATPQLLPQGFYYLNYANGKNVTLLFNVPEPATLSLLALSGLALLKRQRKP